MKRTQKHFRPLVGLGVLAAAGLALFAGLTLRLHSGWQAIAPILYNEIADADQLEGFTLSAQMGWYNHNDLLHFTLRDGRLEANLQPDAPASQVKDGRTPAYVVNRNYTVTPEDRDAVNGAATVTGSGSDGSRTISAPVDRVLRTYTLYLPDNTVIRLAAGETDPGDSATAYATLFPPSVDVYALNTDYSWPGGDMETETAWPFQPTAANCFALGAGYGVCWTQNYLGRAPGLYRAHGLTPDEISALPQDGLLYDQPVLCASTEFGTLEPFYCPADAASALAGVSMADGSTLLLYRTADGTLCADLVNAAGARTDHRELATLEDWTGDDSAILMPRTTDGEAILSFYAQSAKPSARSWLVMLRAENGHFTLARAVGNQDFSTPDAAVLNESGDKILLAEGESLRSTGSASLIIATSQNGIQLRVYELDTGHMTYMGRILTGSERDWARFHQVRNLHTDRFITFDTLQKDGGTLP